MRRALVEMIRVLYGELLPIKNDTTKIPRIYRTLRRTSTVGDLPMVIFNKTGSTPYTVLPNLFRRKTGACLEANSEGDSSQLRPHCEV